MAVMTKLNNAERAELERQIWQTERFLEKEAHNVHVSHEAWLLFNALAEQRGIELLGEGVRFTLAQYFEALAREEAQKHLNEEQRQQIRQQAEQIRTKRAEKARALREQLGLEPDTPVRPPKRGS